MELTVTRRESSAGRRNGILLVLGFVAFVTSFGAHVVAVNLPVYAKRVGAGLL